MHYAIMGLPSIRFTAKARAARHARVVAPQKFQAAQMELVLRRELTARAGRARRTSASVRDAINEAALLSATNQTK